MLACQLIEQKKRRHAEAGTESERRCQRVRAGHASRSVAWSWFTESALRDGSLHAIRRFSSGSVVPL